MAGIELLLRSIGLDPEELQKQYLTITTNITDTMNHFQREIEEIKLKLDTIAAIQRTILESDQIEAKVKDAARVSKLQ